MLDVVEGNAGQAPGQLYARRMAIYVSEGSMPSRPHDEVKVVIGGRVRRYSVRDLVARSHDVSLDFHCVTGWSVRNTTWRVVPLANIVPEVGSGDCWLLAVSVTSYSAAIPCREARNAYLAVGLNGSELPRQHGGPVRLLVPRLYGWKSVKWLSELHIVNSYVDGFWEALGYHERGLWSREERFKVRNPLLLDNR